MAKDYRKNRLINTNRHNVGAVISEMLSQYAEELNADFKPEIKEVALKIVDDIEQKAPRRRKKSEGYRLTWNFEEEYITRYETGYVVYSTFPGLPHLLEFGHASRNGGRVPPSPIGGHIAPAEEKAVAELERRILEVIGRGD